MKQAVIPILHLEKWGSERLHDMFNTTIIERQNLDLGPGLGTPKTTSSMMCKVLG